MNLLLLACKSSMLSMCVNMCVYFIQVVCVVISSESIDKITVFYLPNIDNS